HVLAGPASDGGSCGYSAGAALSPDGRLVLYVVAHSAGSPVGTGIVPSLRLIDLATDVDTLVADGACAPAWAPDGRLAYVQGAVAGWSPGSGPLPGAVLVRASPGGRPVEWSLRPAAYQHLRFVAGAILATRIAMDKSELVLFDRPGVQHVVGTNIN